MYKRKNMLIPALFGLVLAGCNPAPSSTSNPSAPSIPPSTVISTPVPPPPSSIEPPYEIIDQLTPYSDKYSAEYDIKAKLAAAESGKAPNFYYNRYQKVTYVKPIDGDTLTVKLTWKDGVVINKNIRFYNIDTPETHHPDLGTQPWGMAAAQFTKSYVDAALARGEEMILEGGARAVEETYERAVAYVWLGDVCLNLKLLEIGLGTYNVSNVSQETHKPAALEASTHRYKANGYKPGYKDKAISNYDPNWDYGKESQRLCGSAPVESNVCIMDQKYVYNFQDIGPNK